MADSSDNKYKCYHKLVRDRIPSIIRQADSQPFIRYVIGQEFSQAASDKLLEEAYELFCQTNGGENPDVLKESADVLEVVLSILKQKGYSLDDLISELQLRREKRGGFEQGIFLESVDGQCSGMQCRPYPGFILTHLDADSLLYLFRNELERSDKAWIASAFYSPYITNILTNEFERFVQKGGQAKLILSTMGGIVKPEYLSHLRDFVPGLNLRVFHPPDTSYDEQPKKNFHVKAYIFRHSSGKGSAIIGSSNLSQAGFSKNIEWNYYSAGEINLPCEKDKTTPWEKIVQEFEKIWDTECVNVSNDFLEEYKKRHLNHEQVRYDFFAETEGYDPQKNEKISSVDDAAQYSGQTLGQNEFVRLKPNNAQLEALQGLEELRNKRANAGVVIAATGVGKTYLAAFDFLKSKKDKFLFIAHRENILSKARESFSKVLGPCELDILSGHNRSISHGARGLFAMIQTLGNEDNLRRFNPREFDYIVLDEFHRAMAATYRKVIDYFQPDFLLGLTATPERMDGRDVLSLCDYNIAYELRLFQAIDMGMLAPFQYFAVHDPTDYSQIAWKRTDYDPEQLEKALANDTRTALIANNLRKFLPYKGKVKALAFCSSVNHAQYTAHELSNVHALQSIALLGDSTEAEREEAISRLEDEHDPLKIICCVDIFNEGIDIPKISHVLLLRPTQSFTIFLQQLGRGLRKVQNRHVNKSLVVIDFVGNFKNTHVAPLALSGYTSINDYIQDVKNNNKQGLNLDNTPRGCFVSPDLKVQKVWREKLRQILPMSIPEQLKALYEEVKQDLDLISPGLSDFYADPQKSNPQAFIRHFGSWIKTKKAFNDLSPSEQTILGTSGEAFLQYLENRLKPQKSYKMIVLKTIIDFKGTSWNVRDIAQGFLDYYLKHTAQLQDYEHLARHSNPGEYPINNVITHLKNMPLHYLSNTAGDWFILDSHADTFSVKSELIPFWKDKNFKALVLDRVDYELRRYFYRKTREIKVPIQKLDLEKRCIPMDRLFTAMALEEKAPSMGNEITTRISLRGQKHAASLKRPENSKEYVLDYSDNEDLAKTIEDLLSSNEVKHKALKIAYEDKRGFILHLSSV